MLGVCGGRGAGCTLPCADVQYNAACVDGAAILYVWYNTVCRVWVSVLDGNLARRIDPSTNEIDLTVQLPSGCRPYTVGFDRSVLRQPTTKSQMMRYG